MPNSYSVTCSDKSVLALCCLPLGYTHAIQDKLEQTLLDIVCDVRAVRQTGTANGFLQAMSTRQPHAQIVDAPKGSFLARS